MRRKMAVVRRWSLGLDDDGETDGLASVVKCVQKTAWCGVWVVVVLLKTRMQVVTVRTRSRPRDGPSQQVTEQEWTHFKVNTHGPPHL
jgi:hypothetical protein